VHDVRGLLAAVLYVNEDAALRAVERVASLAFTVVMGTAVGQCSGSVRVVGAVSECRL
jgi:hypothetical protein